MNVLITGGAGFIGSTLSDKLLSLGHNIIVIDNFNSYYDPNLKKKNINNSLNYSTYKLFVCDICDSIKVKQIFKEFQIDCVVHIAASAGVRASIEKPQEFVQSNIAGTINILEAMKEYNVKKIVFASSSSVYGNCNAQKFSEDLNVSFPISPYAATKLACEQFLYTYSILYKIQAICLRFFTVYGPRQRPDLAIRKFIELIEQDKAIPVYGDGLTMRDYTYIDDIISGILAAIQYNETQYEIVNLAGGRSITLKEMIQTIETVLKKKALIKTLPMQLGDVDRTVADITKAEKLFNYRPTITFEEGIRKFIQWKMEE